MLGRCSRTLGRTACPLAKNQLLRKQKSRWSITSVVALGILALVAYEIYSGVVMKKVSFLGNVIEFGDKPTAPAVPEASRQFMLGRWEVDQDVGPSSGTSRMDYLEDGTFSGYQTGFVNANGSGIKRPVEGRWEFEKQSKDTFRLTLVYTNQPKWQGTFRIFDQDHIQNTDMNYVAIRVK
jgi:hypothetical protein